MGKLYIIKTSERQFSIAAVSKKDAIHTVVTKLASGEKILTVEKVC